MEEKIKRKIFKKEWGEPLGAPRMPGIEQFTIFEVGNPALRGENADMEAVALLRKKINDEISAPHTTSMRRKLKQRYLRLKWGIASVAKTDQFGNVSMQAQAIAQEEMVDVVAMLLVDELMRVCAEDLSLAYTTIDRFWARMEQEEYKAPELMSTLLMVAQEVRMEQKKPPEVISAKPHGYPQLRFEVPKKIGQGGEVEPLEIRLVSIRQMLRYYFERYPHEYSQAIEAVLGKDLTGLSEGEIEALIEEEIEKIGVLEFAHRIWEGMSKQVWQKRKEDAVAFGVKEPAGEREFWDVCPAWNKERGLEFAVIAKIIAKQLKERS